ncbi:MAG: hypothetical protein H0Z28_10905 [Archaeoglobus sp.]|nr:hypothetical protein [Archaeoglobus sp.]
MVKIMRMCLLIGLFIILGVVLPAAAVTCTLTANPESVDVPVGGSNTSTITINCDHFTVCFEVSEQDGSVDNISAKLEGPCQSGTCSTNIGDEGCINYGNASEGEYDYTLTIYADEDATVGSGYTILVTGGSNFFNMDVDIIGGTIVPELLTAALVGAGLVAVIFLRRE